MKNIFKILLLQLLFSIGTLNVFALGSAYLSVSSGVIENGSSVTASVSISNTAAWNIQITSSGSTSGCTQKFVGDSGTGNNTSKTFSVTCKATSTGIINFSMSGDITSSDGANTKISGNKQVTVTVPREKSKNNKLKSLSVEGYDITPSFSSDVNEYSITVPSTVEKININAVKADNYASLSGTGEKEVEEGVNTFEIVVTSETGVSNVYKLTVNVEDIDPIEVKVNGKKYTVVKVAKNLTKPELFDETTIKIGDKEIPAFINDVSKYTLVGLKDEKGNISLFIYKDGKYTKYNEYKTDSLSIIFIKPDKKLKGFKERKIKIHEEEVTVYKAEGIDKYIVYGINLANGKKNYYTYDSTESTLQKFDMDKYKERLKEDNNNKYLIYGLSGALLFIFILLMLEKSNNKKLKKYIKLGNDINSDTTIEEVITEKEDIKEEQEEIDDDFKDIEKKKRGRKKSNKEVINDVEEENILDEKPKRKRSKK